MLTTTTDHHDHTTPDESQQYEMLLSAVRINYMRMQHSRQPLFITDATGLFDTFLNALPPRRRQHYTCHACRRFVDHFGALVTITAKGDLVPVMWGEAKIPPFFEGADAALARVVRGAKVTAPFYADAGAWGTPKTRDKKQGCVWSHIAVEADASYKRSTPLLTNFQVAAAKVEDYGMLGRALGEYRAETVREAYSLLRDGKLYRSAAAEAMAKWLLDLHTAIGKVPRGKAQRQAWATTRENLLWLAVERAPAGFTHVRSGVLGTLLDDIQANKTFEAIEAAWREKMNPLQYRRPTAAPKVGAIAEAEKTFAALGLQRSLARRFAQLEDCDLTWRPDAAVSTKPEGIFGHLAPKAQSPRGLGQDAPATPISWLRFVETVLPDAVSMEVQAPAHGGYAALVTAYHADAPPIVQWDREDRRNPVTWYCYNGGSYARDFNVVAGWSKVTGLATLPSSWHGAKTNQGDGLFVLIEGARDQLKVGGMRPGGGLFPEHLRADLHGVRSVVEAHWTRHGTLEGAAEATACGLMFRASSWTCILRVTRRDGTVSVYKIDRWA